MTGWKTHLILARASNLPTVWSNVLCAWLLAYGADSNDLILLLLGSSILYTGGMYLNDWFDVEFDRAHRPERPIPAQQISSKRVLYFSIFWLGCGYATSFLFNNMAILFGSLLLGCIIWYNRSHKNNPWSPFTMAGCRALLILWAGAVCNPELSPIIWISAASLFFYIVGLSYVARGVGKSKPILYGSLVSLSIPVFAHGKSLGAINQWWFWLALALLVTWVIRSLSGLLKKPPQIDFTICGLLSGLVCLDLYVIASHRELSPLAIFSFVALFITTLLLQKKIPAT